MAAPFLLPDLVAIFRPFGAALPTYADVPCRIVPNLGAGRNTAPQINSTWTHWADFESSVDVRDNCTRDANTPYRDYLDGDKIATVIGGVYFCWAVAWVEVRYSNTVREYKRAWMVRDCVNWEPEPPP